MTVKDLRELVHKMQSFPDDTPISLNNRFKEYEIVNDYSYDCIDNTINIECNEIGSVLQGHHRVMGGNE